MDQPGDYTIPVGCFEQMSNEAMSAGRIRRVLPKRT